MKTIQSCCVAVLIAGLSTVMGCSPTESHRTLDPQELPAVQFTGKVAKVAIGEFVNRSTYMNGIFADGNDRLGKQAEQILMTHLTQSRAFQVVDRRNLDALKRETGYAGSKQKILGADAVITGAVTEFGRRETGTKSLGGLIQKSRTQTLYAKVSLSVVDPQSTVVVASYQGSGEYALSQNEVLGFGGSAGYDSTLADKVLNLAIMEAISDLRDGRNNRAW